MNTLFEIASMMSAEPAKHAATYGFAVKPSTGKGLQLPNQLSPCQVSLPSLHGSGMANGGSDDAPESPPRPPSAAGSQDQAYPKTPNQQPLARSQLTPAGGRQHRHRSHHSASTSSGVKRLQLRDVQLHARAAVEEAPPENSLGIRGLMSICTSGSFTPGDAASLTAEPAQPHIEVVGTTHTHPDVRRLVRAVVRGLRCCQEPEAAEAGLGGTYFFRSEVGVHVAIVKPCDEEPLAPNNPKGFVGRELGQPGLKPTVRVGEAALREVAAFLLDHGSFAKVPPTVLVRATHPIFHTAGDRETVSDCFGGSATAPEGKLGSLQEFVMHDGDTSEVGASRFAVADVHRIGILDVRLFNTDRHAGNMLVMKPRPGGGRGAAGGSTSSGLARLADARAELRPIDHGFCLPEALEPPYFEWLHWPQAMMPFSEEELAYIAALDPAADCELLGRELPALRPECGRTLQVATALLKTAAAAGLSLSEIGEVMSRPLVGMEEEPSQLERLCLATRAAVLGETTSDADCGSDSSDDSASDSSEVASEAGGLDCGSPLGNCIEEDPASQADTSDEEAARLDSLTLSEDDLATQLFRPQLSAFRNGGERHQSALADGAGVCGDGPHMYSSVGLSKSSSTFHSSNTALSSLDGSLPKLASLRFGTALSANLQPADSLHARPHTTASVGPTGSEELLFDLEDGVGSSLAAGLTRRRSSPGGSSFAAADAASDGSQHLSPHTPAAAARRVGTGFAPRPSGPPSPESDGCFAAAAGHPSSSFLTPAGIPMRPPPRRSRHGGARTLGPLRNSGSVDSIFGGDSGGRHNDCGPQQMAMSVALPGQMGRARLREPRRMGRRQRSRHGKAKLRAAAVYPPPIEGRAPTAVNAVFTGLDSEQWAVFMELLHERIAAALKSGDWQRPSGHSTANPPASCPRF